MRTVVLSREVLGSERLRLPDGDDFDPARAHQVLDQHGIPDGLPFVVDDDGTLNGCSYLNAYLLAAHKQDAYTLKSLRNFHVYHLSRLLRFLRSQRAQTRAAAAGLPVPAWLEEHGEPAVDLTDATRSDLVAYRNSRQRVLEISSLQTEMGCISSFYRYATEANWILSNPIPHWNGRNSLIPRGHTVRRAKFLTARQTMHFLEVGLRGDGSDRASAPAFPERDYTYGLLLASSGLRREEGAFILDCEIPTPGLMPADGIHVFNRVGKFSVTRPVYVTTELAHVVDLYRRTERRDVVRRAQPRLRRLLRQGGLVLVDGVGTVRGHPAIHRDGRWIRTTVLTNEERRRAVLQTDDGTIEPLGLLLGRGGLPPVLEYWNQLFADGRDRVHDRGSADRPPEHVSVSPHTFRHTFAVRMLAALMAEGRQRSGDPYQLLANPVLTVKQLLGHADVATTHQYLYAAATWHDEVPAALRGAAANLVGHTGPDDVVESTEEP